MRWGAAGLLATLALGAAGGDAQLLANIRDFFAALPTFQNYREPQGVADTLRSVNGTGANISQAVHNFFQVPINNKTKTWAVDDPSLGAGLKINRNGVALDTRDPSKPENASYDQAVRLGPNGLTFGPDNVTHPRNPAAGNLGIQALNLGPNGLVVNNGSPLNSTVQVGQNGVNVSGNPAGSGFTHLLIRPHFQLGGKQLVGKDVNGSGAVQALLTNDDPNALQQYQTYDLQSNGPAAGPLPFTTNTFGQPIQLARPGSQSPAAAAPAGAAAAEQDGPVAAGSAGSADQQEAAQGLLPERFAAVQSGQGSPGGASALGTASSDVAAQGPSAPVSVGPQEGASPPLPALVALRDHWQGASGTDLAREELQERGSGAPQGAQDGGEGTTQLGPLRFSQGSGAQGLVAAPQGSPVGSPQGNLVGSPQGAPHGGQLAGGAQQQASRGAGSSSLPAGSRPGSATSSGSSGRRRLKGRRAA